MANGPEKRKLLPEIVIAGAPKCGTSSLFFWLAAHPSICASTKKETHFLRDRVTKHNKDTNLQEHGIEAYKNFFGHCKEGQFKLEATPAYLYEETPKRILAQSDPPPHVIFILREPADRLLSSYRFARFRRKNTKLSFRDFADPEGKKIEWPVLPYEQSCYSRYLRSWVESLGASKIHVFLFERMKADPESFIRSVAETIGIDPDFYRDYSFQQRNASKQIRSKWLHHMGERIQPLIPKSVQEKLVPLYMKLNSGTPPPVSKTEKQEKERLREHFQKEVEELEKLFPKTDFSVWKEKKSQKL